MADTEPEIKCSECGCKDYPDCSFKVAKDDSEEDTDYEACDYCIDGTDGSHLDLGPSEREERKLCEACDECFDLDEYEEHVETCNGIFKKRDDDDDGCVICPNCNGHFLKNEYDQHKETHTATADPDEGCLLERCSAKCKGAEEISSHEKACEAEYGEARHKEIPLVIEGTRLMIAQEKATKRRHDETLEEDSQTKKTKKEEEIISRDFKDRLTNLHVKREIKEDPLEVNNTPQENNPNQ